MSGNNAKVGSFLMSRSQPHLLTCACGTEFTATVYEAVNVTLEPQLLYTVLAGLLNVATCPNCGRRAAVARPFLYHDVARGLFAYVHPRADLPAEQRAQLLERLRQVYALAVEQSLILNEQQAAESEASADGIWDESIQPEEPQDDAP